MSSALKQLEIIKHLFDRKSLNQAEDLVLLGTLDGKRYQQIAEEYGYDVDYVKEVGARLWRSLSETLGRKINKKNAPIVLAELTALARPIHKAVSAPISIKFPSGAMPLDSPFYIERPPAEAVTFQEILKPGSLLNIKAPAQMGKTSLVLRLLDHAKQQNLCTAIVDLQTVDRELFTDLDGFLRWFCLQITHQLNIPANLDEYWDEDSGSKMSCSIYFEDYVLKQIDRPLVLVLDELHQVFEYPSLSRDFLPLLRSWHNESAYSAVWQKLRLVVVHTTEFYIPLKLTQSPFNVGLTVELREFTRSQVEALIDRYQLEVVGIDIEALEPLLALIGGHPYLLQLALYWLLQPMVSLKHLIEDAPTQSGIYRSHLLSRWIVLQESQLWKAFQQVLAASEPIQLEATIAHQLDSLGLVTLQGNRVSLRCELYRRYFDAMLAMS